MKTQVRTIGKVNTGIREVMTTEDRRVTFKEQMNRTKDVSEKARELAAKFNLKTYRPLVDHKKRSITIKQNGLGVETQIVPNESYWEMKSYLRKVNVGILKYAKRFHYKIELVNINR